MSGGGPLLVQNTRLTPGLCFGRLSCRSRDGLSVGRTKGVSTEFGSLDQCCAVQTVCSADRRTVSAPSPTKSVWNCFLCSVSSDDETTCAKSMLTGCPSPCRYTESGWFLGGLEGLYGRKRVGIGAERRCCPLSSLGQAQEEGWSNGLSTGNEAR